MMNAASPRTIVSNVARGALVLADAALLFSLVLIPVIWLATPLRLP